MRESIEQDQEVQKELSYVKECIIEIMSEHKNGVSLAQLPQYLKRKLNHDLNLARLGYPKLKDLILVMKD